MAKNIYARHPVSDAVGDYPNIDRLVGAITAFDKITGKLPQEEGAVVYAHCAIKTSLNVLRVLRTGLLLELNRLATQLYADFPVDETPEGQAKALADILAGTHEGVEQEAATWELSAVLVHCLKIGADLDDTIKRLEETEAEADRLDELPADSLVESLKKLWPDAEIERFRDGEPVDPAEPTIH